MGFLGAGAYLNMMMPPMKVAQRAAPQEVAKERRWASLAAVTAPAPAPEGEPRMTSGTKSTPAAKKHTAARNRVAHPIASSPRRRSPVGREREREAAWRLGQFGGSWGLGELGRRLNLLLPEKYLLNYLNDPYFFC